MKACCKVHLVRQAAIANLPLVASTPSHHRPVNFEEQPMRTSGSDLSIVVARRF